MKRFFSVFGLVLLLSAMVPAAQAQAQGKIGVIDLRRVFDEYYKTKAADSALKDRAAELDKERKALMDQYESMTEGYKTAVDAASDQAVSADERERRKKTAESKLLEIKELEGNITQFDRSARSALEEQQRRMRDNILTEIRSAVTTLAKQRSLSMVIDTAAETVNRTPVVIFNSGENDITDDILAKLNADAPAAAPAAGKGK